MSEKRTASDKRLLMSKWASLTTAKSFDLDACVQGMKRLGYFGWTEDPAGTRLAVRGVPNYHFDPTNPAAIMTAIDRVRPTVFQRGGIALTAARVFVRASGVSLSRSEAGWAGNKACRVPKARACSIQLPDSHPRSAQPLHNLPYPMGPLIQVGP